ncbi:MAG: cell division protein ZapA [Clostridiales bacterium]|jgi:cell division protein ZapA (FtsZ GTPase activity inhibitor)|nr:cell division protein ZapA [Clostridiales bacterium]
MGDTTKIGVVIGGRKYTMQGDESEKYFRQLAWYIEGKIEEGKRVRPMTSTIDTSSMHIIINIADELLKQRANSEQLAEATRKMTEELSQWYSAEIAKYTEQNNVLKADAAEASAQKDAAVNELAGVKAALAERDTAIKTAISERDTAIKELAGVKAALAEKDTAIKTAISERDAAVKELAGAKAALAERSAALKAAISERDAAKEELEGYINNFDDSKPVLYNVTSANRKNSNRQAY